MLALSLLLSLALLQLDPHQAVPIPNKATGRTMQAQQADSKHINVQSPYYLTHSMNPSHQAEFTQNLYTPTGARAFVVCGRTNDVCELRLLVWEAFSTRGWLVTKDSVSAGCGASGVVPVGVKNCECSVSMRIAGVGAAVCVPVFAPDEHSSDSAPTMKTAGVLPVHGRVVG